MSAVTFTANPGEIHALLGENGAGKSTLINVLTGRLKPDAGSVVLDGRRLRPGSARDAVSAGVSAVHQSSTLFERLGWEENLALGGFGPRSGIAGLVLVASEARQLAGELGFELPAPGTRAEHLSVTQRVRLEVMRALSFKPRVLILDEPTGVLPPNELSGFLKLLKRLRGQGRIILLVTHKLAEALSVADRITVLRRGVVVAETTAAATSERALARFIFGRDALELARGGKRGGCGLDGDIVFEIEGLTSVSGGRTVLDNVNLTLKSGEIIGIGGADGNGQEELIETLAGRKAGNRGRIIIAGESAARTAGGRLAVIPQDRDRDGLILGMTLWENMLLSRRIRRDMSRWGWLRRRRAIALCAKLVEQTRIHAASPRVLAAALSGGNRQRFEVARALTAAPLVLVAHNVCRGLDSAAVRQVHGALMRFAAAGGAVLLVSNDLDELMSMCDRIAVLSRGRLREAQGAGITAERIGMMMSGAW